MAACSYGREADTFYFESGRRCASGPGVMTINSGDAGAIMRTVDAHNKATRAELKAKNDEKARAMQSFKKRKEADSAKEDAAREAAIAKHRIAAEAEARRQREAQKAAEAAAARQREEEARNKKAEQESM